ncbi:MAG: Mfa1 fimbrilin C-terminal domain-containing protein [Alistipes sp.]|nr:Mfa1 fimbrilin C-terminal domain-containing protein [Alistipes sp.]
MKKYLFMALAVIGLAACAKEDLNGNNHPIHNGEVEESYIAISLAASESTRADGDDGYLDGTEIERKVASAHFFFFKDGIAFPVNVVGDAVTAPGTGVNHLAASLNPGPDAGSAPNVSDIKNVVLLLKSYKGEYPNQIVAVLNWTPDTSEAYDLAELEAAVNLHGPAVDSEYFIMSNSVYLAGNNVMKATPLTVNNIHKTEAEANADPVKIYVERVAAKVTVTTANGETKFPLGDTVKVDGVDTDVYAHLLGWELHLENTQSYLLKKIDASWTDDSLGFVWNNSPFFRCYWAESLPAPSGSDESFKMFYSTTPLPAGFANGYGHAIGNNNNILNGQFTPGSYSYIGENTNPRYTSGSNVLNPCTKVILKAKLGKEDGTALEIAKWMGQQYIGEANLRVAIANTLAYTLYARTEDGGNVVYTSIKPEDLECVAGSNGAHADIIDDNNSYVQLSDLGETKNWYKLVNGAYEPVAADLNVDANSLNTTNEFLATSVEPSVLYYSGESFYYIDIKHLGNGTGKPGDYGIVRNHIYNIVVKTIGGFGSPTYVGTNDIIEPEYPEDPEDQESFVSAQVNILAWRLVNQEVDVQQ